MGRTSPPGGGRTWPAILLALLVMLAVLPVAGILIVQGDDLYYQAVQEDGWVEWLTVCAFLAATVLFCLAAVGRRRELGRIPWFYTGLSAFCLFVALEEISWGQRLFGFRPPEYFLRENAQQELNLHNLVGSDLRMAVFKLLVLGYGVLLPLFALGSSMRESMRRVDIEAPPVGLVPGFLVALIWYDARPWRFSPELVELVLGLGFFLSAYAAWRSPGRTSPADHDRLRPVAPWALGSVALLVVAGGLTFLSQRGLDASPELVRAARTETAAIASDLRTWAESVNTEPTRCGQHERVNRYVRAFDMRPLRQGEFAALMEQGLPEARATYFIDPWNSPYWIRHACPDGGVDVVFIYSFGPNRRRDSSPLRLAGDDIGVYLAGGPEGGEGDGVRNAP